MKCSSHAFGGSPHPHTDTLASICDCGIEEEAESDHKTVGDKTVSSRGCNRLFIVSVLLAALEHFKSSTHTRVFPAPLDVIAKWLKTAKSYCSAANDSTVYGGPAFSVHDPSTHWTDPQQFLTWWKNFVERRRCCIFCKSFYLWRLTRATDIPENKNHCYEMHHIPATMSGDTNGQNFVDISCICARSFVDDTKICSSSRMIQTIDHRKAKRNTRTTYECNTSSFVGNNYYQLQPWRQSDVQLGYQFLFTARRAAMYPTQHKNSSMRTI